MKIIKKLKEKHFFWGYRRIRANMKYRLKINISNKRVYRLMKGNNLIVEKKQAALLGINHITTSYNNPKGNADTERFMRTFKEELIYVNEFDSFEEAKMKVDEFINYYNNFYLHSSLGYMSPVDFENEKLNKNVA